MPSEGSVLAQHRFRGSRGIRRALTRALARSRNFRKGDHTFHQDDGGDTLNVLMKGRVKVVCTFDSENMDALPSPRMGRGIR
jgi:hypothetical protein